MRLLKKIAAFLLCVALIFVALPISGTLTASAAKGGITGDCRWTLDGTSLTISGKGAMGDYDYNNNPPWYSYLTKITNIAIENGVTDIGSYAFRGCTGITSITIPDSVVSIGYSAFYGCSKLNSITIPDTVTHIGSNAFDGIKYSGWENGVRYIGKHLVDNNQYTTDDCVVKSGTKTIADYAFNFSKFSSLTIPDSVVSIGVYAFDSSSFTTVTIGAGVKTIGDYAFDYCPSLSTITVNSSNTAFSSQNGILFNKAKTKLIRYPIYKSYSDSYYYIPYGVTDIEKSAFEYCRMQYINIPSTVKTIGDCAFTRCDLYKISVDAGNTAYCSVDGVLFNKAKTEIICYPTSNGITSYTVPNGVKTIRNFAFYWSGLTEIILPDGLTTIEKEAFSYCSKLTEITIPQSVTNIGEYAFRYCTSLTEITIPDGITNLNLGTFIDCTSLASVVIPDNVTDIGDYAFGYCSSLASVTIGSSVENIGENAFYRCALTEITIPDSVKTIGSSVFAYTKLTSVTIPESVTYLDSGVFYGCYSLTSATIEANISRLEYGLFYYCDSLKTVTIPKSVTYIDEDAFYDCSGLTDVYYYGTQNEWNKISGHSEYPLYRAKIHCFSFVSVAVLPSKTTYYVGETLDLTGAKLAVGYNDNTFEMFDITADMVSDYNADKIGAQILTITYKGNNTQLAVTVVVKGDLDGDNTASANDLCAMRKAILMGETVTNTDVNRDGTVNIIDLIALKKLIA